jgi:RHS repeat-associated protein
VTGIYTYDATGQRTQSVVAVAGGLTTTTNFTYEGLALRALSASQSGTGATSWKITYLYDENGRPYAGVYRNPAASTAPVVFGMVTTDRGDVVELLDVYGQPFAAYRYDAWGNPQGSGNVSTGIWSQQTTTSGGQTVVISASVATDIANRQVLRYAGYCWDAESGLYYLSARSYDPVTRQFISKDLARSDGEESAYFYCEGAPVTERDPTGLDEQVIEGQYQSAIGTNMGIENINDYIYHVYGPCKLVKQKKLALESFTQDSLEKKVDNCGTASDTRILKYWSWSHSEIPRDDAKIYAHVKACNGGNYYVQNFHETDVLYDSAIGYGINARVHLYGSDPLTPIQAEINSGRPCGLNIAFVTWPCWSDYAGGTQGHTVTVSGYGEYLCTSGRFIGVDVKYICIYDGHRTNMMYINSDYSKFPMFKTAVTTLTLSL